LDIFSARAGTGGLAAEFAERFRVPCVAPCRPAPIFEGGLARLGAGLAPMFRNRMAPKRDFC